MNSKTDENQTIIPKGRYDQKLINLLENTPNRLSKFRTKYWIEVNNQSRGVYNTNCDIRFKPKILKSSLCDYSDAYILAKERITITESGDNATAGQADEKNKGVIFKKFVPFINCKSKRINIEEVDNAKGIDTVMPMYNFIEYTDNYSETPVRLWQYYKDEPNDNITDSEPFKSKMKITGNTSADGNTKDVEIIVPLKYLSNFWRTLKMPLINCELNLILTWSWNCVITNSTDPGRFVITGTKLYVSVVTLSTQDNSKLLQQLKSDFKNINTCI